MKHQPALWFALLLTGCNSLSIQPVVSSIEIQGAAPLVLGKSLQLQATVKDGTGAPINTVPVVWSSSNPTVAEVDQNGKVTAKHFGKVHISARAAQVTGHSPEIQTYGLQVFGGVMTNVGGTQFFLRFRHPPGQVTPAPHAELTVSGPAEWNQSTPVSFAKSFTTPGLDATMVYIPFSRFTSKPIPLVTGNYEVQATIDGVTYTRQLFVDGSTALGPNPLQVTHASPTQVTVQWKLEPGILHKVYLNGPDGIVAVQTTTSNQVTFGGLQLDPASLHSVVVSSFTFDTASPFETPLEGNFHYRSTFTTVFPGQP